MANLIFKVLLLAYWITLAIYQIKSNECYWPDGCDLIDEVEHEARIIKRVRLLCENLYPQFDLNRFYKTREECLRKQTAGFKQNVSGLEVIIKSKNSKYEVLDNSTQLFKLDDLTGLSTFKFIGLAGFSLDYPIEYFGQNFYFYKTNFNFYDRNHKSIRSCEDFQNSDYLFMKVNKPNLRFNFGHVFFADVDFGKPICELIFKDCFVNEIIFKNMVNSYFKTNLLRFSSSVNKTKRINSKITTLELFNFFEIDLDSNLINKNVFGEVFMLKLDGKINSIQIDLFNNMNKIKCVIINPIYFLNVCRRQGIEWIKSMNSHLNVDFSNLTDFDEHREERKEIVFKIVRESIYEKTFDYIYDEDFCLFMDFPFSQMIFLYTINPKKGESCTEIWLNVQVWEAEYLDYQTDITLPILNYSQNIGGCNFDEMRRLCNKTHFTLKTSDHTQETHNFMIVSEFLVILFKPIISLVGVIFNSIVIVVIVKKENRKELKENQYTYMAVHSGINIAICVINILSLVNECQLPFGIYCSSIRQLVFFQYFKIIFGEYFNSFFRLMSNFTYVAFAFNRVSLVGQNHNFLTKFMADVGIKKYIAGSFVISAGLSVTKALQFEVNIVNPDYAYPSIFNDNPDNAFWRQHIKYNLVLIFNVIYDLVNYVLFLLINFLLDILLLVKLGQTMKEKEEKFKDQNEKAREKLKKENKEAFRKVITMVILNSSISLLLKIPIVITSLNDLRLLASLATYYNNDNDFTSEKFHRWFSFPYTMKYFCSWERICEIFRDFGNFLYLASLSLNFVFLKIYDKNFALSYQKLTKKKSNHKI